MTLTTEHVAEVVKTFDSSIHREDDGNNARSLSRWTDRLTAIAFAESPDDFRYVWPTPEHNWMRPIKRVPEF